VISGSKVVLICSLLLGCTSTAPLLPTNEDCMVQPTGSTKWYPCGSEEAKVVNCVNLMELAMKEVDPYLNSMSLPEDKQVRVLKLWDRAKNSCWSDLKGLQPQHYH
jgi:hypothetical protein